LTPDDMSMIKEVEALGVTVTNLSDAEKQAFQKVLQPVYEKWSKQVGPDLVKRAEAAVAKSRKS
jgi:TRAP-type C4-dicarboxylate transport system substrate-binding protein